MFGLNTIHLLMLGRVVWWAVI